MTGDSHITNLGKLIGNLHSLEISLRIFLQNQDSARPTHLHRSQDIYDFLVGTELDESEWTSYDSLGKLIEKFNENAAKNNVPFIDNSIVEIRDALAHGRVSSETESFPLRLIKFSKPNNKKVIVVFNEELTESWFQANINRVSTAIDIVSSSMMIK